MPTRVVPQAGRLVKVSLRDVPYKRRRRAASWLIRAATRDGGIEALVEVRDLTRAVLLPSARTYLLPEAVVVELLGAVPNGQPRRFRRVSVIGGEREMDVYDGWAEG